MSVISTVDKLKRENYKFKANLGCIVRLYQEKKDGEDEAFV